MKKGQEDEKEEKWKEDRIERIITKYIEKKRREENIEIERTEENRIENKERWRVSINEEDDNK